ncbi:MAG: hypothetical protein AVDCRST_MAG41-2105, partial [uncultured Corynebacteriales bacterium]
CGCRSSGCGWKTTSGWATPARSRATTSWPGSAAARSSRRSPRASRPSRSGGPSATSSRSRRGSD